MTGLECFMNKNDNTDFSRLLQKVNSFYSELGPVEYFNFILSAQQRKTKQKIKKRKKRSKKVQRYGYEVSYRKRIFIIKK